MKPDMYKGPERRKYMRLETDYAVSFLRLSEDLRPEGGVFEVIRLIDISGAGIKFVTEADMPAGTLMELRIKFPKSGKLVTAIGRVVRREQDKRKRYVIAVAFAWIAKKDKEAIDANVKKIKLEKLREETRI